MTISTCNNTQAIYSGNKIQEKQNVFQGCSAVSKTIIHICHVFPTFAAGGPQVMVTNILNALPKNFRHTIIAVDGDFSAVNRIASHVQFSTVTPPHCKFPPLLPIQFTQQIRALNPDLLVTQGWNSIDAVLGAPIGPRRRWIHMETGFEAEEAKQFKLRRIILRRILLRRAKVVLVPSMQLESIAKRLWRVKDKQLQRISNGVDVERFQPGSSNALRQELGIKSSDIVVGTVANLRPVKDPLRLLEAFYAASKEIPHIHLIYAGDGEMKHAIEMRTSELGLQNRVHLLGNVKDTAPVHRLFDIFALSSLSEQGPISLIEAMSSGKPVVSTEVGDISNMVSIPNKPFIVSRSENAAFSKALVKLLSDADLRREIGKANRARVLHEFKASTTIEAYQSLYERVALDQTHPI